MTDNLIVFRSSTHHTDNESKSKPEPAQSNIPEWYKEADRFAKDMFTGEYYKATKENCPFPKHGTEDDYGMIVTWKACPALMDSFMTGYVLKTPCDITFFKNKDDQIDVKVHDEKYKSFCSPRNAMQQFKHPKGYYKRHFAWLPDWSIKLPEGYSCLYMNPMNRFDLPFLNTTGVVDNDKIFTTGTFPFFIVKGFEGTIKAGTPYMQIFPFKRENWISENEILTKDQIDKERYETMKTYRQPDGGVYKNTIWTRRQYR